MNQTEIWYESEGAAWARRNKDKMGPKNDPVLDIIDKLRVTPKRALEFGCANGWRLKRLRKRYGCIADGVDPAAYSIDKPGMNIHIGDCADPGMRLRKGQFDLIIYGFCLYVCDRADLFKIAMVGDTLLEEGGYLVIHDFASAPHSRIYKHHEGVTTYKMNYENLWLWNPAYTVHARMLIGSGDELTTVVALHKNTKKAFPLKP